MVERGFLVDTNIFLNIILKTKESEKCKGFFDKVDLKRIYISDFSFYSIGIILFGLKKFDDFNRFATDLLETEIEVINISLDNITKIRDNTIKYSLDFDDSYQYTLAREKDLKLVTYDKDFLSTDIDCLTPEDI